MIHIKIMILDSDEKEKVVKTVLFDDDFALFNATFSLTEKIFIEEIIDAIERSVNELLYEKMKSDMHITGDMG